MYAARERMLLECARCSGVRILCDWIAVGGQEVRASNGMSRGYRTDDWIYSWLLLWTSELVFETEQTLLCIVSPDPAWREIICSSLSLPLVQRHRAREWESERKRKSVLHTAVCRIVNAEITLFRYNVGLSGQAPNMEGQHGCLSSRFGVARSIFSVCEVGISDACCTRHHRYTPAVYGFFAMSKLFDIDWVRGTGLFAF